MALISHSRAFVFVKTMKTAGTSLEVHLSRSMDAGDIVTPIYPPHAGHRPRNYHSASGAGYFNHMPFSEIRTRAGSAIDGYFSFCFERHPVQKCLSYFGMLLNSPAHQAPTNPKCWGEYLERGVFPVDTGRYADEAGTCLVNRVYRYEEMDAALRDLERRIGIPARPLAARGKTGFRLGTRSFEDVMASPAQRDRIMAAFASSLAIVPY